MGPDPQFTPWLDQTLDVSPLGGRGSVVYDEALGRLVCKIKKEPQKKNKGTSGGDGNKENSALRSSRRASTNDKPVSGDSVVRRFSRNSVAEPQKASFNSIRRMTVE